MTTRLKSACKAGILVAACVSLAICSSCSDEDMMNGSGQSDKLSFGVSLSNEWKTAVGTRSTESRQTRYETFRFGDSGLWIISSEEDSICNARLGSRPKTRAAAVGGDNFYQSFDVYGYVFEGSGDWEDNQASAQLYMSGEVIQGTDVWSTASTHFWPGSRYSMKFFAYAPRDISSATVTTSANQPSIAYTVPQDVAEQVDLLVAAEVETVPATDGSGAEYLGTVAGDYGKPAKLHFYHALTAIKVKAVGDGLAGTITKVELKGVKGAGTHSFGSKEWTLTDDDEVDFSQTLEAEIPDDTEGTTMVIHGESTFMMIPQTLGENAALQITFHDGTVLTGSLSGKEWPMGKTVVYRISRTEIFEEYSFTVTPENMTVVAKGGKYDYQVSSYLKRIVNGKESIKPVPWKITGYQVEGEWTSDAPDWLQINLSGNGVDTATGSETETANVSPQEARVVNEHNDNLKAATTVSGTYNLSNPTGAPDIEQTANCYVINAPGTYSLPLVYGNAIDKKIKSTPPYKNEKAYYTDEGEQNMLEPFLNHTGKITSPYIYDNEDENGDKLSPSGAKLIWQDAKDLVSDVKLSTDKHSLIFTVERESIVQGNAVVAVLDADDKVMWSWHIWVTDYKLGDDLKIVFYSGTSYTMLPYNLGWCDGEVMYYDARSIKVRFEQEGSGEERVITINQTEATTYDIGNQPYYQWGRKDPMLPAVNMSDNKEWYDASGTPSTNLNPANWQRADDIITNGILYPGTYCTSSTTLNVKYRNLWAAGNYETSTALETSVKTVYDPCPVGYKVPLPNMFKAFTASGSSTNNPSAINGTWRSNNLGYDFNCSGNNTVYFPRTNYRNNVSGEALISYNNEGNYWSSAVPANNFNGYGMNFRNGYVNPATSTNRVFGCAVRPVQED